MRGADVIRTAPDRPIVSPIILQGLRGLSLKVDFVNRAKETFQQLDNFDLYIPGTIRKVLPATKYNTHGAFPTNLLNCCEYLAQPNASSGGIRRIIAVGADGKLYDLNTATPNTPYLNIGGTPAPAIIPYMVQSSGFYVPYNIRSWQAAGTYAVNDSVLAYSTYDGNLYVFAVTSITSGTSGSVAPVWPSPQQAGGVIVDNGVTWTNVGSPTTTAFLSNFLYLLYPGSATLPQLFTANEWRYNPNSGVEAPKVTQLYAGLFPAQSPLQLDGQVVTPNLNGYAPSAGRAYLWTFYNPNTLQESAPSPFTSKVVITETDNGNTQATLNGSVLLPLPPATKSTPYSSYQSYYVSAPLTALSYQTPQGVQISYPCIRVYATKDGGSTFYLVTVLFDDLGNQITNSDGSIPIALLTSLQAAKTWKDYTAVPGSQSLQNSFRVYEGSGPLNYAPDPINLGSTAWFPSPTGAAQAIYVDSGGAPDGANAFKADGTGANFGNISRWTSAGITLNKGQTYYFQMYLDNAAATAGNTHAKIIRPGGAVLLDLSQPFGTASTLNGTFSVAGSGKYQVKIQVYLPANVNVPVDSDISWADPVLQLGNALNTTPTNYPTTDDALITPAPLPGTNYPPPIANSMEVFDDALFLIDTQDQTKIWYSSQGQFGKYGQNAYVRTTISKNADQVLELIKCFDRLLVTKGRSVQQIVSYPPSDPIDIDPQHGVLARRASITWGSSILALLNNGLGQIKLTAALSEDKLTVGLQSELFGDDVKPIIDSINAATLRATNLGLKLPCPTIFNSQDQFLLAYSVGGGFSDNVLMYALGQGRGFSRLTALPGGAHIITLKEVQDPNTGAYLLLALCDDGNVYNMFSGTQDGTITATAVTQPLPTPADLEPDLWDNDKVFQSLVFEGQDLSNFQVYIATDLQFDATGLPTTYPYGPFSIINSECDIGGIPAKQIVVKLVHSAATAVTPMLSYMSIEYDFKGERI